jgi:hypothetical protein
VPGQMERHETRIQCVLTQWKPGSSASGRQAPAGRRPAADRRYLAPVLFAGDQEPAYGSGHGPLRTGAPSISVLIVIGHLPVAFAGDREHASAPAHSQSLAASPAAVHREKPWILGIRAFSCVRLR